jgi:Zn finger protein HypA/HybF involved in hydrogenase expression
MGLNKKKKVKTWCTDHSSVSFDSKGLVRCPTCNKRLAPRFVRDAQGEVIGQSISPHKEK